MVGEEGASSTLPLVLIALVVGVLGAAVASQYARYQEERDPPDERSLEATNVECANETRRHDARNETGPPCWAQAPSLDGAHARTRVANGSAELTRGARP